MNRLDKAFDKGKAFTGYLMGGDGGIDYSTDCALQLIQGGVDILEIGMPFSDPIADGPVIQRAAQRALKQGTKARTILDMGQSIRKNSEIPLILFSYFNPLFQKGVGFLKELRFAGFDAVLLVDLPSENQFFSEALEENDLYSIFIVAPSTDNVRLDQIQKKAKGFIYYACQKGTTGVRARLSDDFSFQVARIRQQSSLPIVAGFGIATCENAEAALRHADGFVVGSAFVNQMEAKVSPDKLKMFAESLDPRKRMLI